MIDGVPACRNRRRIAGRQRRFQVGDAGRRASGGPTLPEAPETLLPPASGGWCFSRKGNRLANSADYFIRDFVVSIKQRNIFEERPGLVRQFAGNWYIVSNLEPNITELSEHLEGISRFTGSSFPAISSRPTILTRSKENAMIVIITPPGSALSGT